MTLDSTKVKTDIQDNLTTYTCTLVNQMNVHTMLEPSSSPAIPRGILTGVATFLPSKYDAAK